MISWEICETCIKFGTVVDIAKSHISQQTIVHNLGAVVVTILVDITDNLEHWTTDDAHVKVNCDDISLNVRWIDRGVIVILFILKNFDILCVK